MPGPGQAAVFATAVFVLNATPGVDFLLTVTRTLQGGARAGVAAVAGINAGCVLHALAAAFGLAALLAVHPGAFRLIQWAGAAYLVWLGIGMLRQALQRGEALALPADAPAPARPWSADFRVGLLTNVLNPKVALFFLAFLPQFVPAGSPSPTVSFLLLGAWFVVQGGLFSLALVALAARLAQVGTRPGVRRWLNGVGGLLFIGLALRILRERPVGT
ncbi:MAG: LysE family translocator [Rubrivivax sp.]|nr:LysE family translocator [Rubrivivax sp.]